MTRLGQSSVKSKDHSSKIPYHPQRTPSPAPAVVSSNGAVLISINMDDSKTLMDPANSKCRTFFGYCNVEDLPDNIPSANLRPAQIDKALHKEIINTLVNQDAQFHEKNSGITIVADRAEWDAAGKVLKIKVSPGFGVINGGHTLAICLANRDKMQPGTQQWVPIIVKTGVPKSRVADIAEGLNSSLQVKETSLMTLRGYYDWVQKLLAPLPCASRIEYTENCDNGVAAELLVRLMVAMDVEKYPIEVTSRKDSPIISYQNPSKCLERFRAAFNPETGESRFALRYSDVLFDILSLHDFLIKNAKEAYVEYSRATSGRARNGSLMKKSRELYFGDSIESVSGALDESVIYATMSAFRQLLEIDPTSGHYRWVVPFSEVKAFARKILGPMVNQAQVACEREKLVMVARNPLFWSGLLNEVRANLPLLKK